MRNTAGGTVSSTGRIKARQAIATGTADAVEYDSDRTCCICRDPSKPVQLHHLDGNRANNRSDNLAVLCLDHHHEATAGPGLGRGLRPGVIRQYRNDWLRTVKERRERKDARHSVTHVRPELVVEAMACLEVRKLGWQLERTPWRDVAPLFEPLDFYANRVDSEAVRVETMEALDGVASRTRYDMPADIAGRIVGTILPATGIISLVGASRRRVPRARVELLRRTLGIGSDMAYDAVKYLGNIRIVDAGARIMFYTLRYATLNRLTSLKREALKEFEMLEALATKHGFKDALRWLAFVRQDALAIADAPLPALPRGILKQLA